MRAIGLLLLAVSIVFIYLGFRQRGVVPGPASQRLKASIVTPTLVVGMFLGFSGAFMFALSFGSTR
jgi:hypothetical protein